MTFLTILTFKTIFGHYLAAASGVVSVLHRKYVAEINTMRNCLELICWLVTFSAYFDKLETLIRESTCCSIPSWSLLSWRPLFTLTDPRTLILDGQDHWKLIFLWFLTLNFEHKQNLVTRCCSSKLCRHLHLQYVMLSWWYKIFC